MHTYSSITHSSKVVLGVTYTNPFFGDDKLIIRERSLTKRIFDIFNTGMKIKIIE